MESNVLLEKEPLKMNHHIKLSKIRGFLKFSLPLGGFLSPKPPASYLLGIHLLGNSYVLYLIHEKNQPYYMQLDFLIWNSLLLKTNPSP